MLLPSIINNYYSTSSHLYTCSLFLLHQLWAVYSILIRFSCMHLHASPRASFLLVEYSSLQTTHYLHYLPATFHHKHSINENPIKVTSWIRLTFDPLQEGGVRRDGYRCSARETEVWPRGTEALPGEEALWIPLWAWPVGGPQIQVREVVFLIFACLVVKVRWFCVFLASWLQVNGRGKSWS